MFHEWQSIALNEDALFQGYISLSISLFILCLRPPHQAHAATRSDREQPDIFFQPAGRGPGQERPDNFFPGIFTGIFLVQSFDFFA
jgi:hypothetical protein